MIVGVMKVAHYRNLRMSNRYWGKSEEGEPLAIQGTGKPDFQDFLHLHCSSW